jgi:hypothetical protein
VEDRVETPSRGPGDGSGNSQGGEGSDASLPSVSAAARMAAGSTQPVGAEPVKRPEPPVTRPNPIITPSTAPPSSAAASAPSSGPAAPLYRPAGDPASPSLMAPRPSAGNGGTSAQAALAGAANSARGLAAKVSSSFSGMTKPKPRGSARPGPQVRRPAAAGSPASTTGRPKQGPRTQPATQQTRSAMLSLQRIEPISVMKFSFMISLVAWVVLFIAVAILYFTLSKLGVFAKIEQTVGLVTYNKNHPGSNAASWFSASRVLEYTALVCTFNAILFTALATVGAALYNLVTGLTGGIEVTLRESD